MGFLLDPPRTTPASTYTGPGDITSFTAYWGVWAYNRAYALAHGSAFDLRRSSDNATMTAAFLSDGQLDTATISTWAGAANIFISRGYDQTGNGRDVTQATNANQPQLILSGGLGGFPYVQTTTSGQNLNTANVTPVNGVSSLYTIAYRPGGSTSGVLVALQTGNLHSLNERFGTANQWTLNGSTGSINATASDNAWHDGIGVINGASSLVSIDGADTTGTVTGGTAGGQSGRMIQYGPNRVSECGYADGTAWSSGTRASLRANARTTRYAA